MDETHDSQPSRARDHLANERTYLAWLRTAGGVMVLGLAVATFGDATTIYTIAAGAVLIVVGVAGLFYGTRRYRRVNREIEHGEYTTGSGPYPRILDTVGDYAAVGSVAARRAS
ncbi:YidH family protein [Knoellia subterranea]|uniref:DUF202 domain-containing protein n=1 Tax=Knoellia subterranea KCTC 19937 TaxID=1385521 RepID=A0A0A0JHP2_9MICO|nr:DUF202 domain-containing protein [Knoellia subterranea]KGN35542.1 hypothetical protein N803_06420 [Knoellia subterranea KCTC 19937]